MNYSVLKIVICIISSSLLFLSCSSNDSQREFEQEAFSFPDGITKTNNRGEVVNEQTDPDDWRVAPFFQGLVIVDPAFPNPVQTTGRVNLNIQITGVDAVSRIRVFVFYDLNSFRFLFEDFRTPLPPGLVSFNLNPLEIARIPENPQGIYRIIVEDYNRNVITYGDIQIE